MYLRPDIDYNEDKYINIYRIPKVGHCELLLWIIADALRWTNYTGLLAVQVVVLRNSLLLKIIKNI